MDTFQISIIILGMLSIPVHMEHRNVKRSIDLFASHSLISDARLSRDIIPKAYEINIRPNIEDSTFQGNIKINLIWNDDTKKISLHAHHDLQIIEKSITLKRLNQDKGDIGNDIEIPILRMDRLPKKNVFVIYVKEIIKKGSECELYMEFGGNIWETTEGLFKGYYSNTEENVKKQQYLCTNMRPNNARRLFPCFDEPGFKVSYTVSISRPRNFTTLFNTPLIKSEELMSSEDYVVDFFEPTPPMSSFSFGFIISQLELKTINNTNGGPNINIWAKKDLNKELEDINLKVLKVYQYVQGYFNVSLPILKVDVVAIPELTTIRPIDNWGLLVFKEAQLFGKGFFTITQEIIYQWLGAWITPYWWSDAHINKALASFIAAEIVIEIDNGDEFNGKYPMTYLYSLYYEFSKRYPHSRITGMKQETTSFKTELVMRMLNFTLSRETFKKGIQKFIADRHYTTFFGDDLWDALTKQGHLDGSLSSQHNIAEIAGSWITKDRLPVVNVFRNYKQKSATISQKVYLRERPHDVPEQDKMLWWIPIVLVKEDKLNFENATPYAWVEKTRDIKLQQISENDQFIIVNPEEIGPFPVNYDEQNWNLISQFLQKEIGQKSIPTYTRAKLLHDAWNLAYAGDLSFGVAFNMTLFMQSERNHIVWYPVFTFIDHIGRHIDMSSVHKKFKTYVRSLLTPLYEELGEPKPNEEYFKTDLRSLAKTFLCQAGYRPCIEEAQQVFALWMKEPNPDNINPVPNQFICPVFKWGTIEEWEFGLNRVIHFPKNRSQSDRTYLLKTLAGCPVQPTKINRLLNITILENSKDFSENDIFLIFSMLTGGSSGYMTLFNFLSDNWETIKQRFENKTNLWDSLIGSATGVFTTQEGYNMVKNLHETHSGDFGSAEHIIEKSLKNIREETKWSDENLPVIENWLNNFLKTNNRMDNKFLVDT